MTSLEVDAGANPLAARRPIARNAKVFRERRYIGALAQRLLYRKSLKH